MKFTQILFQHHKGWYFYRHWHVQARKRPIKTPALKVLEAAGVKIHQPEDIMREERTLEKIEIIGYKEKPVVFDKTHPDWHDNPLLHFKDNNVLMEGLEQAKVLTKTIELQEGLPESIQQKDVPKEADSLAKQIIKNCQMFDAEQKKLPIVKDPLRPFHTFARVYGITQNRRNILVISKLLQLLETRCEQQIVQDKYLFSDLLFSFPFKINKKQIQFQLSGDFYLSSSAPLKPITNASTENFEIANLSPLEPTISILKDNIYRMENIYPINQTVKKRHPHTLFVCLNREETKNHFEEPMTDSQIFGRSLLKAFTVAASYARQTYGNEVKDLPLPVTIQCVQTDGRLFHFGVFQLNTLNLEDGAIKNIWWQNPFQYLFEKCSYDVGKPTLEGYNGDILKQLFAFYNNV